MKFEWLGSFAADWGRLHVHERRLFERVVREQFHPACDRFADDPSTPWPRDLRVKRVKDHPGVWEMTWSFAGPDGRAAFEWIAIDGALAVRWRRIGGHEVFGRP